MLTKKQADWFYGAFFNGLLKVPYGQRLGFVYDYVGGGLDSSKSRVLANVLKMARGGKVEQAQALMNVVFTVS